MEPGHEDREYSPRGATLVAHKTPQWSPVMKTGNTPEAPPHGRLPEPPQWSPVMKTGNTGASKTETLAAASPQWSPVMKTGNTRRRCCRCPAGRGLNGARS